MSDSTKFLERLAIILDMPPEKGRPETEIEEGAMDSLQMLDVIALLDETFDVTVATDELIACRSMGEVLTLVKVQVEAGTKVLQS